MTHIKYAQSHNKFGDVPKAAENWKALRDAYQFAGVTDQPRMGILPGGFWALVSRKDRQNIYDIAQFRYNGLVDGTTMDTVIHVPKHGGHVHAQRGTKAEYMARLIYLARCRSRRRSNSRPHSNWRHAGDGDEKGLACPDLPMMCLHGKCHNRAAQRVRSWVASLTSRPRRSPATVSK